jgi:hypothetical protein
MPVTLQKFLVEFGAIILLWMINLTVLNEKKYGFVILLIALSFLQMFYHYHCLLVGQVHYPVAFISALMESTLGVLLRFVLFDHVLPPSVDALNIISKSDVVLLLGHTT